MNKNQQGFSLIAVLLMLLLITVIGVLAMRRGLVNLGISTSGQAQSLLIQSSDVPLASLTRTYNTTDLDNFVSASGPLGFLRLDNYRNAEYVLCYQPTTSASLFQGEGKHLILVPDATTPVALGSMGLATGYCNITNASSYTSPRKAVMTQIAVTRPNNNGSDSVVIAPFEASNTGTDNASVSIGNNPYYRVYSTSVLPAMTPTANDTTIDGCMKKPSGGLADATVSKGGSLPSCLKTANVPNSSQVQDFVYVLQK